MTGRTCLADDPVRWPRCSRTWRLLVPVLPDAISSPLQRAAGLADSGSGIRAYPVLDRAIWD